jgi:nucleotide-binding universal stress UspA family protein
VQDFSHLAGYFLAAEGVYAPHFTKILHFLFGTRFALMINVVATIVSREITEMNMKILIALDSSASSKAVVSEIAGRQWPEGTMVRVLNVVGSVAAFSGVPDIEPLVNAETEAAKALVETAVNQLASRRIEAYWAVIAGNPRAAIVDYARAWGPDFIFIGSHGHNGISRFFLGSIAKTVLRHAPCSVGILRAFTGDRLAKVGPKILLATDGSKYSEAAVRSVARRPWPKHTKVKLVSVIDPSEIAIDPLYGMAEVVGRASEIKKEQAQEALSAASNLLSSAGLKSDGVVLIGDARAKIIDEAKEWEADLMVVGAQGRGGIDRILQGSVSDAVAIHAHCSVEVIHDRAHFP